MNKAKNETESGLSWRIWLKVHVPAMTRGFVYTVGLLLCTVWIVLVALAPWVWWLAKLPFRVFSLGRGSGERPATDRQKSYLADLEGKSAEEFDGLTVEEASARITRHTGT